MNMTSIFYVLNTALRKAMAENAWHTYDYLLGELKELPNNLKLFVVSEGNGLEEIVCESRKMAEELWKTNKNFKEMYYFNPQGDCTTIKTRK